VKDKKLNQSTFTPLSHVKIEVDKAAGAKRDLILINKIDFAVKNLTSNTELPCEKVVISYEKRSNTENYIKEAKYDMAVGHLLLKSFWANTLKNWAHVKPYLR
jgi:hypothetical protein